MDDNASSTEQARVIDLTRQTDVLYWCRIFDVTMDQLREAVHHAGWDQQQAGGFEGEALPLRMHLPPAGGDVKDVVQVGVRMRPDVPVSRS